MQHAGEFEVWFFTIFEELKREIIHILGTGMQCDAAGIVESAKFRGVIGLSDRPTNTILHSSLPSPWLFP